MPEQTQELEIVKSISVVQAKANDYLPNMRDGSAKAVARLKQQYDAIVAKTNEYDGSDSPEIDQLVADVSETLSAAKNAYDLWNKWRVELTAPMDEFKKQAMEYEKAVAYDGKTDNYYTKIRQEIVKIENKKIAKKRVDEETARKKKELENYKVDLTTNVKRNFANLLITRITEVNKGSKDYFDASTLETFDERAETFKAMKPKLKQEHYDSCLLPVKNDTKLTSEEKKELLEKIVVEETYDKWNLAVSEAILPTINEWRAKIPMLKQQLVDLANAKSEEDRKKLEAEQAQKAADEQARKDAEIAQQTQAAQLQIDTQAQMDKMNNEFVEQATVQSLTDTAPVKYQYVLKDPKLMVKGLMNAIYHTLSSPKFKGIYKMDKSGKKVIDPATGQPTLIPEIDYWFKFAAENCDVELEGMELVEIAKVTIKK